MMAAPTRAPTTNPTMNWSDHASQSAPRFRLVGFTVGSKRGLTYLVLSVGHANGSASVLFRFVRDHFTRRDLGRIRIQRGQIILPHPIRGFPVGLLRAGLILKDAGGNHHATAGVHPGVGDEPWKLADQRHNAFIDPSACLTRIGHTLVAPYCCIHNTPPSEW